MLLYNTILYCIALYNTGGRAVLDGTVQHDVLSCIVVSSTTRYPCAVLYNTIHIQLQKGRSQARRQPSTSSNGSRGSSTNSSNSSSMVITRPDVTSSPRISSWFSLFSSFRSSFSSFSSFSSSSSSSSSSFSSSSSSFLRFFPIFPFLLFWPGYSFSFRAFSAVGVVLLRYHFVIKTKVRVQCATGWLWYCYAWQALVAQASFLDCATMARFAPFKRFMLVVPIVSVVNLPYSGPSPVWCGTSTPTRQASTDHTFYVKSVMNSLKALR